MKRKNGAETHRALRAKLKYAFVLRKFRVGCLNFSADVRRMMMMTNIRYNSKHKRLRVNRRTDGFPFRLRFAGK